MARKGEVGFRVAQPNLRIAAGFGNPAGAVLRVEVELRKGGV